MNNITQEYVAEYLIKNDKNIEELKNKINILENEKALMTERNANLGFRISTLEQQVRDLNNTLMNHFAYGAQEYKRKNPVQDPIFGNTLTTTPGPQGPPGPPGPSAPQGPILGMSPPPGFSPSFSFPTSNPFNKN
jgi:hypothetical protein